MLMVNPVSSLTFKLGFSRQRTAAVPAEFDLNEGVQLPKEAAQLSSLLLSLLSWGRWGRHKKGA